MKEETVEICTDCGYRLHYAGDDYDSFIRCSNKECGMVVTDFADEKSDWSKVKEIKLKDYKYGK